MRRHVAYTLDTPQACLVKPFNGSSQYLNVMPYLFLKHDMQTSLLHT